MEHQSPKQKIPAFPLWLLEYRGTAERAFQPSQFATPLSNQKNKEGLERFPVSFSVGRTNPELSHSSQNKAKRGCPISGSTSEPPSSNVPEITFHYPPFSQLSSSPTSLDKLSGGGLYRNRNAIYELGTAHISPNFAPLDVLLKKTTGSLFSGKSVSSLGHPNLMAKPLFMAKSWAQELIHEVNISLNLALQNQQIRALSAFFNQKPVYFQERWEPITLNSWLVVTKIFYVLWSLNLLGSLYNNYGKELLRSFLELIGGSENLSRELGLNPTENQFRVFENIPQSFQNVAIVDNVLLELSTIVWYLRTFQTGSLPWHGTSNPRGLSLKNQPPSSVIHRVNKPKDLFSEVSVLDKKEQTNPHINLVNRGGFFLRSKKIGHERFEIKIKNAMVKKEQPFFAVNRISNKLLFVGPPGTGKTLLVKAISGEAQVPVLVQPASTLIDAQINGLDGETGSDQLTAVFEKARTLAPCILFIDEIDTLGGKRKKMVSALENADFFYNKPSTDHYLSSYPI